MKHEHSPSFEFASEEQLAELYAAQRDWLEKHGTMNFPSESEALGMKDGVPVFSKAGPQYAMLASGDAVRAVVPEAAEQLRIEETFELECEPPCYTLLDDEFRGDLTDEEWASYRMTYEGGFIALTTTKADGRSIFFSIDPPNTRQRAWTSSLSEEHDLSGAENLEEAVEQDRQKFADLALARELGLDGLRLVQLQAWQSIVANMDRIMAEHERIMNGRLEG